MRQREIERKHKAKLALRQLEKLKEQVARSTVTKVIDGKLITTIEFNKSLSLEKSRLAALVSRHPELIRSGRKKKSKPLPKEISGEVIRELLFTDAMLARRWHCSTSRLQHWRSHAQGLPYMKIHGRILYRIEDILAYENASIVKPQDIRLIKTKNKTNKI